MKKALIDAGYPRDWPQITDRIRFERAKGRCECRGECGKHHGKKPSTRRERCLARHEHAHPITGSLVLLQTAHLDHDPSNCVDKNLRAMCQHCHLSYDGPEKARRRRGRERNARAWRDMWE